jgi:ABC-type glycerol-3-phosphate transport system permease component
MAELTATHAPEIAAVGRPRRGPNVFRVVVYVVLTFAAFVYIAPFLWMVGKSLQNSFESTQATLVPAVPQWENYDKVLNGSREVGINNQFRTYLGNTLKIEVITVVLQTVICVLAAYAFARMRFPGRDLLFGMLLLTMFVPSIILLVPNLIVVSRISQAFEDINPALKWMDSWPALVIPFLSNTFSIFLLRQFFKQIPDELWDAARIDGTGHLLFLTRIVVPISWAPIMTTILFCFVATWSALEWPILVTSSAEWRPIAVALQQFRQEGGAYINLLMAAAVIALLPVMLLYLVTQRFFTQGVATTGLK